MRKALAIATLIIGAMPGARAGAESDQPEWGQTVDGLRMSVAISTDSHGEELVRVTVNYVGDRPLLLPFAFITGQSISRYRLQLVVAEPGGPQLRFGFDGATVIRGRFDPLVIPMAPAASYTLELPFAKWRTGRVPLQALVRQPGQLWVEWDCVYQESTAIPSLPCPLYGYPNSNQITCWQEKLTSNRIALPK
jgi:hypothetical protein